MILVFGATGNVGRPLIDMLTKAGQKVRAASRTPSTARLPDGVDICAADLSDPESLPPLFHGVDRVFLLFHIPGDPAQPAHMRHALAQSSVRHIVLLSSMTVEFEIPGDLVGRHHREAEEALSGLDATLSILRPGTFMSNCFHWAAQVRAGDVVRSLDYRPAAVVDERDIAAVAAKLLSDPVPAGGIFPLTGGERVSGADQVRLVGEALGRPLRFDPLSHDEAIDLISGSMPAVDAEAILESVASEKVPWAQPRDTVRRLLGRSPGRFNDWARDHCANFTSPDTAGT